MSALGQKRTFLSLDHLVGDLLEMHRHVETQCFGRLEVDDELMRLPHLLVN
jgi:hypothetical protein